VVIDPIRNELGRLVGFAKITRDVTERRDSAEQLEKAREALFQSQKLEALGKLTGGVAHDFNNLLNVVVNSLALLRRSERSAADLRLIDTMEHAVRRGATLTQQLLSFARQQPMKHEQRDASRVIASFEAVLRRASGSATTIDVDLAGDLPPVKIDVAQFETGLLNLVVNARDATQDRGRIVVSTGVRELKAGEVGSLGEGRYVTVSVQDTGVGIAPEILPRVIEPFFTTKEIGKGTGLGLSQVYGMVQQCGGDLQITSRPGEGTTVAMYFPALADDVKVEGGPETAHERVLLVDDEPDLLETTGELFRTLGFDVLSANSGEEALELLKRTPDLQLLFSDIVMPGMSGIELARKARTLSPALKVILASGYVAESVVEKEGPGLSGFEFLAKPYRLSDLVQKLRKLERTGAAPAH
jgi:signal transduction histidine kinase/CheY-like chemotaxis protein